MTVNTGPSSPPPRDRGDVETPQVVGLSSLNLGPPRFQLGELTTCLLNSP